MNNSQGVERDIAKILREIGTDECLKKAEMLENGLGDSANLHFRSLGLEVSHIVQIAAVLKQGKDSSDIRSISFSYNPIRNSGAIALAESLPSSLTELGLVGCGIADDGGLALLQWLITTSKLQMICIEQNNFSSSLRKEFQQLGMERGVIVIV